MASDRKDPGAIWQGSTHAHQDQSLTQKQLHDEDELPALPDQQQARARQGDLSSSQEEDAFPAPEELAEELDPAPAAQWKVISQDILFLLIPLILGGLTCLAILPNVATGHAQIPPLGLWPVLFFIILIALAQELAIYFSGANKSMRILATVGGFFLFLLASCFILYGLMPGFGLLIVLVLLSVLLVRVYVHLIPEGYVDIVNSFGRYSRTLYPGFNILLPWEKVLRRLNTGETQWICPPQRVQLSPDEDLVLRATISYQLLPEDAYLAVTQVNNWEESLREQFKIILQTIATQFTPHDFVVWPQGQATDMHTVLHAEGSAITGNFPRWERVNTYLFQQLGDSVALWGVQINWVRIRDVALTPHGAPVVETPPPVERAVPAKSTAAPPATAQKPAAPVQAAPEPEKKSAAPRSIPAKFLKEEVLIKAYKEVQDGKITDPLTIHSLAEKFEAVANDPQACQTVSFDAARAAHTLHKQAQKYEELYVAEASFEEKGQASWPMSNPSDENLMAGG